MHVKKRRGGRRAETPRKNSLRTAVFGVVNSRTLLPHVLAKVSLRLTSPFPLCLFSLNPLTLEKGEGEGRKGDVHIPAEWKQEAGK